MGLKESARQNAKAAVLHRIKTSTGAVSAREVARALGWSWQHAALTLRYLAATGDVLVVVEERKDPRYRVRRTVRYMAPPHVAPEFPEWLCGKSTRCVAPVW